MAAEDLQVGLCTTTTVTTATPKATTTALLMIKKTRTTTVTTTVVAATGAERSRRNVKAPTGLIAKRGGTRCSLLAGCTSSRWRRTTLSEIRLSAF